MDYVPRVCGVDLQPITLETYSRLVAFESPFVCGGPIDIEAVVVFVWVHHRDFSQWAVRERREVVRQVWRALHPRYPNLNRFLAFVSQLPHWRWLRRFVVPAHGARYGEAVTEIRRLVAEALADLPRGEGPGEDDDGNPKVESEGPKSVFQAQVINSFARVLRMTPHETATMPLRRAAQLFRELIIAEGGGKGLSMMHPDEAKVWRDYLDEPTPSHG